MIRGCERAQYFSGHCVGYELGVKMVVRKNREYRLVSLFCSRTVARRHQTLQRNKVHTGNRDKYLGEKEVLLPRVFVFQFYNA